MKKQIFKDIPGFEGFYQFSNDGQVKSLQRIIIYKNGNKMPIKEKILKSNIDNVGYFSIDLHKNNKRKTYRIHTLVCTAFHGPCPEGMECRHLDGNPLNNNESNLCWGTHTENISDKLKHGTDARGEKCCCAKLTWETVEQIRKKYVPRIYTQQMLADEYKTVRPNISLILNNKHWVF